MNKDFLGQKVEIGDWFFYTKGSRHKNHIIGEIVDKTEKTVVIKHLRASGFTHSSTSRIHSTVNGLVITKLLPQLVRRRRSRQSVGRTKKNHIQVQDR